jgi:hypothetical protein
MTKERRLQFSTDTINTLFDWANVLLVMSLGTGVVATATIVWTAKVKEAATNRDIAAANTQIAAARERTAELELQTAKLQARLAPRVLDAQQRAEIARILSSHGKPFGRMFMSPPTPEAQTFARQLFEAMKHGGWDVHADVAPMPAVSQAYHSGGTGFYYREHGTADAGIKALVTYLNDIGFSAEAIPWGFTGIHQFYIVVSPK